MGHLRILATALALVLNLALATACVKDEPRQPRPDNMVPVDLAQLRQEMYDRRPDRMLHLIETNGKKSMHIRPHDHYFGNNRFIVVTRKKPWGEKNINDRTLSKIMTYTNIPEISGNRLCAEPKDNWTGVCLSLWRDPTGRLWIENRFGNGYTNGFFVDPPLDVPDRIRLGI